MKKPKISNPFQFLLGDLPAFLKNKYVVTFLIFLVWMVAFDDNKFIRQYHLYHTLQDQEDLKKSYQGQITELKAQRLGLLNNPQALEQFAREEYLMKRENEEIILFVPRKPALPE